MGITDTVNNIPAFWDLVTLPKEDREDMKCLAVLKCAEISVWDMLAHLAFPPGFLQVTVRWVRYVSVLIILQVI